MEVVGGALRTEFQRLSARVNKIAIGVQMSALLDLGISQDDLTRLLRGLHEGKYNLLLGAGASYGCKGGDGVELRDGATLSTQIATEFGLGLNSDEARKLPLTYEEAESANKPRLQNWP